MTDWMFCVVCQTPGCGAILKLADDPTQGGTIRVEAPDPLKVYCPSCKCERAYAQDQIEQRPAPLLH